MLEMARYSTKEIAQSAFTILNELMGEIHGGRLPAVIAIKKPDIFMTKYPQYIVRGSITVIVLSLRKFDDLWIHQIMPKLLADNPPKEGIELHEEIKKRKLRKFCNVVLAHYATNKLLPKTPDKQIEKLLIEQGFDTNEEFLEWTRGAINKIGIVRDKIADQYGLNRKTK